MLGHTHKEKSSTSLPQPNGYGATDSTPTLNATNYGACNLYQYNKDELMLIGEENSYIQKFLSSLTTTITLLLIIWKFTNISLTNSKIRNIFD